MEHYVQKITRFQVVIVCYCCYGINTNILHTIIYFQAIQSVINNNIIMYVKYYTSKIFVTFFYCAFNNCVLGIFFV